MRKIFLPLLLLLLTPNLSLPSSNAVHDYQEELSITTAGDLSYWSINLIDVNTTGVISPELSSISGIDSFVIFHYSQKGSFNPRFDIFTTHGYGAIDSTLPKSGAILNIKTNSQSNADKFASLISQDLHLGFITYNIDTSSKGMTYSYYSYADSDIITDVLLPVFNNYDSGFNQLINEEFYKSNTNPTLIFSGKKQSNAMIYSIELGGTTTDALVDSTAGDSSVLGMTIDINNLFGVESVNASLDSTKSTISLESFGSTINSNYLLSQNLSDSSIAVSHDIDNINSKLTIELSNGGSFNNTIPLDYYPPVLSVVRIIDKTVGYSGDTIESRITFTNLSPEVDGQTIDEVVFTDDWWTDDFTLLISGEDDIIENLLPGQSVTISKLLQIDTDEPTTIVSKQQDTSFEYKFTLDDKEFSRITHSNSIHIELNDVKPALIAFSLYNSSYVTMNDDFVTELQIKNLGSRAAYSVDVILNDEVFETFESIAPNSFEILELNVSRSDYLFNTQKYQWDITWSDGLVTQTISSNPIFLINDYNYYGPAIIDSPNIVVDKVSDIPVDGIWQDELEVILRITNNGDKNISNIRVSDILPSNVIYLDKNSNITRLNNRLEAHIPLLQPTNSSTFVYNIKSDLSNNILLPPVAVLFSYNEKDYKLLSESVVLPTAVYINKEINTNTAPVGYNYTISVDFSNNGALMLFGVQLNGNDAQYVNEDDSQWNERSTLEVNGDMNYEYSISSDEDVDRNLLQAYGEFVIGGQTVRIFSSQIPIEIVDTPIITIKTIPDEILDNQEIELIVIIDNPSDFPLKLISITNGQNDNIEIFDESLFTKISLLDPKDSIELRTTAKGLSPGKPMLFQPVITHEYKGQLIQVDVDEFSVFVSEEMVNRYIPSIIFSLIILFVTVYLANKLVFRKQ